jgi:hypothetical protein
MKFGSGVKVTRPEVATVSTPRVALVTGSVTVTDDVRNRGAGLRAQRKTPLEFEEWEEPVEAAWSVIQLRKRLIVPHAS